MSETTPAASAAARPAGPKRPSLTYWLAGTIVIMLMAYLFTGPCSLTVITAKARDIGYLRQLQEATLHYADEHDGRLPPTLWALVPKFLSEQEFTAIRYCDPANGERFDWLYFPKEKYDKIPDGTILIASPGFKRGSSGTHWRFVWGRQPLADLIPEADFQRLIREQNPPPAK